MSFAAAAFFLFSFLRMKRKSFSLFLSTDLRQNVSLFLFFFVRYGWLTRSVVKLKLFFFFFC